MNNNNLDKFIHDLESIAMTKQEKNKMRDHLATFAKNYTPLRSPYQHISLFIKRGVAIAFIVVLSVGSLSQLVSGAALPGDTLYPVKLAHEKIKLAATFNTQKKIEYGIKRTEKRIREATKLASKRKLDDSAQNDISENIKKQALEITKRIEEVKNTNPNEAFVLNAELKSTIEANAEALKQISTTDQETTVHVTTQVAAKDETNKDTSAGKQKTMSRNTQAVVSDNAKTIADQKQSFSQEVDIKVSFAEKLLNDIESELEKIEAFDHEVSEEITHDEETNEPKKEGTHIEQEIDDLEAIAAVQQKITEIKGSDIGKIIATQDTGDFDEADIQEKTEAFITQRKYQQALLNLNKILNHYKEEIIIYSVELDLGIDISPENHGDLSVEEILQIEPPQETETMNAADEPPLDTQQQSSLDLPALYPEEAEATDEKVVEQQDTENTQLKNEAVENNEISLSTKN